MKSFDAIIIGAGPAGLLLGKEISKKHSVLILEKSKVGKTNKNWLTYEDRWRKEGFPEKFIGNRFKKWFVQMSHEGLSNEFVIKDNFICFDEHKFLKYLANMIIKEGGAILEENPSLSFKRSKEGVIVNNKYKAPLLIDCSGVGSLIVRKHKLVDLPIYINCYAYIGEFNNLKNKNYYCSFRDSEKSYASFGLTKIAPKLAQLQLFKYSNKRLHLKSYKKLMLKEEKRFSIPAHKIKELKIATYPTGVLKKQSLDNIFLFGDAGFFSPSTNGMGFNEILRQHHRVAKHLMEQMKKKKYGEKDLQLPDEIADDVNNLLFRFLGLIFNNIPPAILSQLFDIIKTLKQEDIRRIMRNDVTDREALELLKNIIARVNMSELIKVIEKSHVKYILKTLWELDKDIITEEMHNLIFMHHKFRIKDLY